MQYLNSKQAAEYLGKSDKTIRRWITKGQLKAEKENGKHRISKRSLDRLRRQATGQMSDDVAGKNGQAVDGVHPLNPANQRGISRQLRDILEAVKGSQTAVVPRDENPLIEELRGDREALRQENVKLWNLLGRVEQESKRLKVAVGQYKNDDGDTYHYCRKHVGMVRKSGLKPEPFQHPGDSRKLAGLE